MLQAATLLVAACGGRDAAQAPENAAGWVPSWIASPTDVVTLPLPAGSVLRQSITPHAAGTRARLKISNRLGSDTLSFAAVTIAGQPLLFDGAAAIDVPAGESVYSDPLALPVEPFRKLTIDLTSAKSFQPMPQHAQALERPLVALPGAPFLPLPLDNASAWFAIAALEVQGGPARSAVVAVGDSLTDGYVPAVPCAGLLTDPAVFGRDLRYPDFLAQRLLDAGRGDLAVVNAGISGNRVNDDAFQPPFGPSLRSRLAADVLAVPSVRTAILLEGINDLGLQVASPDAQALIDGLDEVVRSLQAAGVRVVLGTLTPALGFCEGPLWSVPLPAGVLSGTPAVDAARQAVNQWIRTVSSADAIADFNACLHDPAMPSHLAAQYDSGDHLHLNPAGYRAMADCIDLDQL